MTARQRVAYFVAARRPGYGRPDDDFTDRQANPLDRGTGRSIFMHALTISWSLLKMALPIMDYVLGFIAKRVFRTAVYLDQSVKNARVKEKLLAVTGQKIDQAVNQFVEKIKSNPTAYEMHAFKFEEELRDIFSTMIEQYSLNISADDIVREIVRQKKSYVKKILKFALAEKARDREAKLSSFLAMENLPQPASAPPPAGRRPRPYPMDDDL